MTDDQPVAGTLAARLRALSGIAHVVVADEVDSTNLVVARTLATDPSVVAERGAVVAVASRQTAGRGRRGRTWTDVADGNVAISVALPLPPVGASLVPLAAAMAVRDVVQALGAATSLKWPNDVRVVVDERPRKVAGILVEAQSMGPRPVAIVGIGIDVDWRGVDRSAAVADDRAAAAWSSLAEAVGGDVDHDDLVVAVVAALCAWHVRLVDRPAQVRSAYEAACATLGQQVHVDLGARLVTGRATGLDPHGALEVTTSAGVVTVAAGDLVHLRDIDPPPS